MKSLFALATLVLAIWNVASPRSSGAQEAAAPDPLIAKADSITARLERERSEIDRLEEKLGQAQGEDRQVLNRQLWSTKMAALEDLSTLTAVVVEQEEKGLDTTEARSYGVSLYQQVTPAIWVHVRALRDQTDEFRARRDGTAPEEQLSLEFEIERDTQRLDQMYAALRTHIDELEELELPAQPERDRLTRDLQDQADLSAGRINLYSDQTSELQARLQAQPDDAPLQQRLFATHKKLETETESLAATVETLNALDVETAEYQALLLETTKDVLSIFEGGVAVSLVTGWFDRISTWFEENGLGVLLKALIFIVILFVFRLVAKLAKRGVGRALGSSHLHTSELLNRMILTGVYNAVMALGFLIALSQLGISLGPLLAGLGVVGFILGFALQNTIANFASGMMILLYRPFDVGDLVEAGGVFGRVDKMSLVSTTILTMDNQALIVPNNMIWGDVIKNVTAEDKRRVDLVFGISYTDDIPKAEAILSAILVDHPMVLEEPEPMVRLYNLGESSVDFVTRPWCKTDDYWDVYWDVTREVKIRFDAQGVSIPFPQRDVHIHEETQTEAP